MAWLDMEPARMLICKFDCVEGSDMARNCCIPYHMVKPRRANGPPLTLAVAVEEIGTKTLELTGWLGQVSFIQDRSGNAPRCRTGQLYWVLSKN